MVDQFLLVVAGILVALVFDFGNGFNDAANSISTVIATRVLTLKQAVILAAAANFVAAFIFGIAVATTIGKGIIDPQVVTPVLILSGLVGSIAWVYFTTFMGLPISASHALIGGLIGAGVSAAGFGILNIQGIWTIILFIFIAPIAGLIGAVIFSIFVLWIVRKMAPASVNGYFKKLQLLSVSAYSLSHGTNDAQKTIGIITILLFSAGYLGTEFTVPFWVILLSYGTIAAGTLAGGWKVVKTLGLKLTNLKPMQGFCAESSGALTIIICSIFGIPVSTTHVISGAITGVGITRRASAVRWVTARKIVWAWIFTIPAAAIISFISYKLLVLVL
jgi:PiT family inorganic phosphate transporter